ncbi:hypothetical protein MLD38_032351 [Melastoma candidum]|uniref:Uncharacterized protein n=1 Tax=Melastoma candidum TaxID=119954 RepID=A0ACB9M6Z2_9MYRT|nr:hypothetical protein MLD38_032351 [Melastoma candidum]
MDMELIMKLIYAGCVLPRVLRTSHVLFYPKVGSLLVVIAVSLWMKYMKSIEAKSMDRHPRAIRMRSRRRSAKKRRARRNMHAKRTSGFYLPGEYGSGSYTVNCINCFPRHFPGRCT